MLSSLQSDVKEMKTRLDIKETKKKSTYSKTRPYRSAIRVIIRPRINTTKTKRKVDKSMDVLKRTLNLMVEYINEKTTEGDISKVEDCITQFLEYSSSKGDIVFIEESLELFEKKLRSAFKHQEKVRMAIMKKFFSFVINLREKYKAKFVVNDGSLLIVFYFESLQGFKKFTEDLRNGIIQEEMKKVVQYDLFLWIFKLKKDDVIVELEECTDIGNDDAEIEGKRKLAKTCTECHRMRHTTCPVCEFGFCEKCWITHCHVHAFEKIEQQPASAFPARCSIHEHNTNTTFCKTCNTYLCELCPTESHSVHDVINLKYQPIKADIKAGTKGVHVAITDIYESIYSNMKRKRKELPKQYELLKDKIKLEGKKLHEKVDDAVKMQINILEDMQNKHLNALENSIQKMKDASDDVSKMIASYEEVLKKGSVEDIIYFETNMESLKIIPEWSDFTFPVFKPRDVEEEVVFEWMGDLIPGVPQEIQELNLYPHTLELPIRKVKQLIENPIVSQKLLTGLSGMRSLVVDLEEKIWTSGYNDDTPSLFVLPMIKEGVKPTKLETFPMDRFIFDMCFNFEGDLVFSDSAEGSVDIWKEDQVIELVRLQDWTPMGVYATTEDILVCMIHTSTCCKKIVRHREGYIEHFEFDQDGEPLFSDEDETLYIAMNPNSDLCVSDYGANKVLVLNKWGLLRFTYTGETTLLDSEPFGPRGITTDAMSRILIADCNNHCVHILDHTGKCLSLIENNDMRVPWTLDTIDDKVVIGNYNEGSILVLKYLE